MYLPRFGKVKKRKKGRGSPGRPAHGSIQKIIPSIQTREKLYGFSEPVLMEWDVCLYRK